MTNKHDTANQLQKQILALLESQPTAGFRRAEIRRFLGRLDEKYFRAVFKKLVETGKIVKKRGGRYVPAEAAALKCGVIRMNPKGFGFVKFKDNTPDAFIPQEATMGALTDDQVLVKLDDLTDSRGPSGSVRKIIARGHDVFVGCLDVKDGNYIIRPLRRELPPTLPLVSTMGDDPLRNAQLGDWIQARLVPGRRQNTPPMAEIVRRISARGGVLKDLDAIVKEYGLPRKYTKAEGESLVSPTPLETPPRKDCRDLVAVTIDPIDAKDYDDALSCLPGPEPHTVVLGVHIADVACFVTPDSKLDKHAQERGFTSYLPGRTISMLPESLSTQLCCLREGEDRMANSVFMTIDMDTGKVIQARREHTIINVTQRLTFKDVTHFLQGQPEGLKEPVCQLLERLAKLTRTMRKWRIRHEMFLPLAVPEHQVLCGGRPVKVQDICKREENPASFMVEECMLAANVQVALEMRNNGIPALYRNHAEPDVKGLEDFATLATAVLGKRKVPQLEDRGELARFLAKLVGTTPNELLAMAFLRCLPRACYGIECEGHFGLGKDVYCHFTSPIRRYPDLLVHQQLLARDLGKTLRTEEEISQQALDINELEANIDQAGFAALDRMKLRYLEERRQNQPETCFEAYVMRATADHLILYLPDFGIMGMMENTQFGDARWFYDPKTASLVNRTGQEFKCGSIIYVQIKAIDPVHGELNLKPVQMTVR